MARPLTSSIALAFCTLVLGAAPALGQSTRARVRASVTILDPVGVSAASPLVLRETDAGALVADGTFEVTSPVPHVLTTSEPACGIEGDDPSAWSRTAGREAIPRRVRVEIVRPEDGGRVHLTYTVAVIL